MTAEALDAQQLVLSHIVRGEDGNAAMVTVLDSGITEPFFSQPRWLKAWQWIYEYWKNHGTAPQFGAYKRQFPNVNHNLVETTEPLTAVIAELREKRKYDIVLEGMQQTVDHFDADKVDDALATMATLLTTINTEVAHSSVVASNLFISKHVEDIYERHTVSLLGVPTGFPTIDEATNGLQPEQLITLIGLPKSGKTSIAMAIAIAAQRYGKRVLFQSFEMSVRELQDRYVSIGAHVSLNRILKGQVTLADKDLIGEFEAYVYGAEQPVLFVHDVSSTTTVGRIGAEIEQHRPDFVIIDGAYMMEDELGERRGTPQALTNITRSAKRLAARSRIPILMTTQALKSRTGKKGLEAESVGYSSSFAQDSDTLLGVLREDPKSPRSLLSIIIARNALGTEAWITFDYDLGLIAEEGGGSSYVAQDLDDDAS